MPLVFQLVFGFCQRPPPPQRAAQSSHIDVDEVLLDTGEATHRQSLEGVTQKHRLRPLEWASGLLEQLTLPSTLSDCRCLFPSVFLMRVCSPRGPSSLFPAWTAVPSACPILLSRWFEYPFLLWTAAFCVTVRIIPDHMCWLSVKITFIATFGT